MNITYVTDNNIVDLLRLHCCLSQNLLQESVENVVELAVLETTLESLSKGCTESQCDNDIIGLLLAAILQLH